MPREPKSIASLEELGVSNPLSAVPVAEQDVQSRYDKANRAQLCRRLPPKGRIYPFISNLLRYRHDLRVDLDEVGSLFWQRIDGRRTLSDIADVLRDSLSCSDHEARTACVTFARDLMIRRMIFLRLPAVGDAPVQELRMRLP